ncbi:MAG TPA: hydroxymethylbilane synthase [Acidothermaceae bacterium]|jgi:hydroxymethylbilane synthase|nr:hydroxymethylbilane synthase [Acidothermaceae bacterium]
MSALTSTDVLRLGTRRSALAKAQAATVADSLRAKGFEVELLGFTTEGDRSARVGTTLAESGGLGVFVADLRLRLLAGEVDLVVHSLKDLPTAPADGLVVAAVPAREDPRDALVARDGALLVELPAGASVGTGSPRRAAQLRAARPDLDVRPLRGNVDTRVGKVASGELDAVVVAAAGLARLGRLSEATELLDPDVMLPAPGQGALAVECRVADVEAGAKLRELAASIDDFHSRAAVAAERALLADLEAGCTAPVGALATFDGTSHLQLVAAVVSVDGATAIRRSSSGPAADAEDIGRRLAADLLAAGAGDVIGREHQ